MTMDAGCTWKGELTTADVTCTWTVDGALWASSVRGVVQTKTLGREEFNGVDTWGKEVPYEFAELAVVMGTTTGDFGAEETAKIGTESAKPGTESSKTGTESAGPESTGMAAARAYPTGILGLVGGAVAVLGAAVAL